MLTDGAHMVGLIECVLENKCCARTWNEIVERNGQCHCGSLRVIATGDPERVYLCHCKACQRRTSTAFHFGATYLKERVRLEGERKIYEREADTGYRIRFHFCPHCGSTTYWEGDRNRAVCRVAVGVFEVGVFPPPGNSIFGLDLETVRDVLAQDMAGAG
jgi:hypothetical protein